jgi:hypothetical protein
MLNTKANIHVVMADLSISDVTIDSECDFE